jgi:hypothetical protein
MKKLMFSLAFMLIGLFVNANNYVVTNSINKIENCKKKSNYYLNLGDISNLSDKQISIKISEFYKKNLTKKVVGSCTITVTGSIGIGQTYVSATVTATASTCAAAAKEAQSGLSAMLAMMRKVKEMTDAWISAGDGIGGWTGGW